MDQYPPPNQYPYGVPAPPYNQKYPEPQVNQPTVYPQVPTYGNYSPINNQHPQQQDSYYTPPPPPPVLSSNSDKFIPRPKYHDLWALILFLINFAAFTTLSVIGIKKLIAEHNDINSSFTLDGKLAGLVMSVVAVGGVLSFIYMILIQSAATFMCHAGMIFNIIVTGIATAYFFIKHQILFGIFGAIMTILAVFIYFGSYSKIPFTALLLTVVTRLTRRFYGTMFVQLGVTVIQITVTIWWLFSVVGVVFATSNTCQKSTTKNGITTITESFCATPGTYAAVIYSIFAFYWISNVIKNIGHITAAGVFSSYYFLEGTPQQQNSPTISALKRSLTTSLGPNCYGSLIIAIISTIKAIARSLQRDANDLTTQIIGCIAVCILSCIESIAEYISYYAWVQVAMYGKSFCEGARDTFRIMRDRGVEQIINDQITGFVISMGAILIGIICALVSFGFIQTQHPAFNDSGNFTIPVILGSFVVGMSLFFVIADVIHSGISTIFVGLAEDPRCLAIRQPDLFAKIEQTYPQVAQGV